MKLSIKGKFWASRCHQETNHSYDGKPYTFHLQMVSDVATRHIHLLPEVMIETVFAAIWAHDTIEDCRRTYNDVRKELGTVVADIVYAVTNEKGKNRDERANDKYYAGIMNTPFAAFVKICDRIANMEYSLMQRSRMGKRYVDELPHFINKTWMPEYKGMFDELNNLARQIKEL